MHINSLYMEKSQTVHCQCSTLPAASVSRSGFPTPIDIALYTLRTFSEVSAAKVMYVGRVLRHTGRFYLAGCLSAVRTKGAIPLDEPLPLAL